MGNPLSKPYSMENHSSATRILEIKESFLSGLLSTEELIHQLHDVGMDGNVTLQWLTDLSRENKNKRI